MRLHHLTMTAFGPFADTVAVDFDQLSSAGLFLLTGATGAGKTSVLDAVCFALYGQVPGDRAGAKHLRSDHAAPGRAPQVVLELSVGERRFRFTRSPAWSRPKLRGNGETKVQAHVVVEEHREDDWTALTNRLDDAGLLVSDLLGMTCGQFTQVAMLPQGRFQAFLRASSAERHAVLQQLFRTDRFERVEKWLVERRSQARRAAEAGEAGVRAVLHRVEEAGAATLPEDVSGDLGRAADSEALAGWIAQVTSAAVSAGAVALASRESAEQAEAAAAEALREARSRDALNRRAHAATTEIADLDARQPEHDRLRARLALHHQAAPLSVLATRSRRTAAAAVAAADVWRTHLDLVGPLVDCDGIVRGALVDALRTAQQHQAVATAFLPRERDLHTGEVRRQRLHRELERNAAETARTGTRLETLPAEVAAAEARREAASTAAAAVPGARSEVDRLAALVTASRRLAAVGVELADARAELMAATTWAQQTRETYLDAREARINGMAAELAGALASGCSCPVCGSSDHPAPARVTGGSVGRTEEDAARRTHEDAAFAEQGHQVRVAGLESELASLRTQAGDHETAALSDLLEAARRSSADLTSAAADAERATAEVTQLRDELTVLSARSQDLQVGAAAVRAELDELGTALASLHGERAALLAGSAGGSDDEPPTDVAALLEEQQRLAGLFEGALAAWDALENARTAAEDDTAGLFDAAAVAGFNTVDEALAALLDGAEADAIAEDLRAADARRLAARQTLADADVQAVLDQPPPDLDALAGAHAEAIHVLRSRASAASAAATRAERLAELGTRLDDVLGTWAPLRARHRLTAELASLVEGRSVDNPLRMRLAAYVLSERLRQVVAAANERLSGMTGERYALEHSEDRGVGELRGGLSLRIRDDWNGVHRDPATLSGGETFVVSLALALGLADTVAHEAGGTDIDTLFIDEGFGSLDPDTLEDVMDTLDALRDGGRVVGLVSHVPELRSRITTQLEVSKGRTGSTLRPVLVGG